MMANNCLALPVLTIIKSGIPTHIFNNIIVAHDVLHLVLSELDLKMSLTISTLLKSLLILINQLANGDNSWESSFRLRYVKPFT